MSEYNLWGLLIFSGLFTLLFASAELLKTKTRIPIEYTRKLVHLGGGFIAYFLPHYFDSHWPVLILTLGAFAILWLSKRLKKLDSVHGVARVSQGALIYPISLYLLFLLANNSALLFQIPVLVLAFSDTFGALIGQAYGTIQYKILGHVRSLEGSIAFLVVTFLTVHIPLLLFGNVGKLESLLIALLIAVLVTAFEAISLGGSDNLFIPFGAYFVLARLLPLDISTLSWLVFVLLFLLALGLLSYRQQQLTIGGAIGAFLVGYGVWTLGGLEWFLPILVFYLTYNLIERFSASASARTELEQEEYELSQIFYVCLASLAFVVAYSYTGWVQLFPIYLASVSANSSISWMTFLKKRAPRRQTGWLRSLRWLVAIAAGLIPLAPFLIVLSPSHLDVFAIIAILAGAAVSIFLKELFGWTVQASYQCAVCGLSQEKRTHCNAPAQHNAGWSWLNIDRAHLISIVIGSSLGYFGGAI
jgi:phytol kinase